MPPVDTYGLVGQVLDGQFRVDAPVGEGGFSVVYRGHHLGLDEPVAIKCLKLSAQLGSAIVETFIRRFRDESKIHYKLSQSSLSIARTIAAGTTMAPATNALVPYMVLEWLEGFTLSESLRARRLRGEKGRSLTDVIKELDPVAEAMALAHANGVVHRDLNPSNIFCAAQPGGGFRPKLMDFGVAKIVSDHALSLGPRTATLGSIRMFTPAYGAPEQFSDGLGAVSPATDVYAFALLVVELLLDRTPISGDHLGDYLEKALDPVNRPTPRTLGAHIGDAVEIVLAQALSVEPSARPQDIGTFWGLLKNAATRDAEGRRSSAPPAGSKLTAKGTMIMPEGLAQPAPPARASKIPTVTQPIPKSMVDVAAATARTPALANPLATTAASFGNAPAVLHTPLPAAGVPATAPMMTPAPARIDAYAPTHPGQDDPSPAPGLEQMNVNMPRGFGATLPVGTGAVVEISRPTPPMPVARRPSYAPVIALIGLGLFVLALCGWALVHFVL